MKPRSLTVSVSSDNGKTYSNVAFIDHKVANSAASSIGETVFGYSNNTGDKDCTNISFSPTTGTHFLCSFDGFLGDKLVVCSDDS